MPADNINLFYFNDPHAIYDTITHAYYTNTQYCVILYDIIIETWKTPFCSFV